MAEEMTYKKEASAPMERDNCIIQKRCIPLWVSSRPIEELKYATEWRGYIEESGGFITKYTNCFAE